MALATKTDYAELAGRKWSWHSPGGANAFPVPPSNETILEALFRLGIPSYLGRATDSWAVRMLLSFGRGSGLGVSL